MPHPRGDIAVKYRVGKKGSLSAEITLPEGVEGELIWNGEISDAAIIVKMIRVMMLVPVLLTISYSISVATGNAGRFTEDSSN